MKNNLYKTILLLSLLFCFNTCITEKQDEPRAYIKAQKIIIQWTDLVLKLERNTAGYRPPVSARMFAYIQITAYQTSLPALKGYSSLKEPLLPSKYIVGDVPENFDLPMALNAAYAHIVKRFFFTAPQKFLQELASLEKENFEVEQNQTDENTRQNSIKYGKAVAEAIWQYAMTDKIGHDAFLYNFDKTYTPPQYKGSWQPSSIYPMPALLPHWSMVRTFINGKNDIEIKPPVSFDESPTSDFYKQAMEVYLNAQHRSFEDVWIADFWSDDLERFTITPVGRWFSIANQYVTQKRFSFPDVLETYLKLGIALNDAAVICWNAKYFFNIERPETFIQRNIDAHWQPLHNTPAFPAYPSGHAIFGASAVEILKHQLGNTNSFTDKTHDKRTEFQGKPRTYHSLDEMATENAYSRVIIGVHFRMDCEEGLRLGKIIGQKIAHFLIKKDEISQK